MVMGVSVSLTPARLKERMRDLGGAVARPLRVAASVVLLVGAGATGAKEVNVTAGEGVAAVSAKALDREGKSVNEGNVEVEDLVVAVGDRALDMVRRFNKRFVATEGLAVTVDGDTTSPSTVASDGSGGGGSKVDLCGVIGVQVQVDTGIVDN